MEFTFNEPADAPFTWPHRRGFEQMLRKLARLRRAPAVLVLHHYAWWFAAGDGADAGLFYRPAEAQLGTLAQVRRGGGRGAAGRGAAGAGRAPTARSRGGCRDGCLAPLPGPRPAALLLDLPSSLSRAPPP